MKLKKYATDSKHRVLKNLEGGSIKTQTQIAEKVGNSQQSISRVITDLEKEDCVKDKGMTEGYQITQRGAELLYFINEVKKL